MKGATPAMVMLERSGIEFAVHAFDHDLVDAEELGYGRAAAHALGVDESRVFKTLLAQSEKSAVVAIVPVSSQLSLKALAQVLGVKRCEMVPANDAQRITGYVVGGISPFGQKKKLLTVVDESAIDLSTMFVSGGRRGLDIEVAPTELIRVLDALSGAIATSEKLVGD
jgi:Cys-tRNA(Pro)/Cys-tRNA(Cys) deacylase